MLGSIPNGADPTYLVYGGVIYIFHVRKSRLTITTLAVLYFLLYAIAVM